MPRPAHELLTPGCPIKPAWAQFDEVWYVQRYADARAVCGGQPHAALAYYLRVGARLGHSPSALFDEIFYLARNPDVAELVRAGTYASGFDHYCRFGHRLLSPHWLFDDALYADLHDDMSLENLDAHGCYGRYDHYLKSGQRERRMGHFLFDAMFYREAAIASGVPAAEIDAPGPYVHFLARLGLAEELPPSIYFDPAWYVERHPAAKAEIARGRYYAAIQHYLTSDAPENLDPVPQFSEGFYRRRHPDIAAAVEAGMYRSGYQQFIQYGAFELRQPSAEIDLAFYRDMNERVRDDLQAGEVRDAFAHLRLIGLAAGLAYRPPDAKPTIDEAATREQFIKKARHQLLSLARAPLDFTPGGPPVLSVIMVLFNRFELTMLSLASLRDNFHGPIELILVDNDSHDETRDIARYVTGAKILRLARNGGFVLGCNAGLSFVTAPVLLFLNNDVELGHNAIAVALARLRKADDIAAVCGKIIRSNGLLQEAGSIIWAEGTTTGYLRDASPLAPEANFLRDVDYGSAVFLLCRTQLVKELGGFDVAFAPAYFEDADLCVRLIQAGWRIVYDPAVLVHHLEFGSAATTEASMALMRRGRRIFKKKHAAFLQTRPKVAEQTIIAARSRGSAPKILFVEDTIPLRRLGSGFVRSNDALHAIAATGYEAHVFPINGSQHPAAALLTDMPESAEILYNRDFMSLPAFLQERAGIYDLVWVARTHNLPRILPLLHEAGIKPPIILDTEAVAANRLAAVAALYAQPFDLTAALRAEFADAKLCRQILTVSAAEASQLASLGLRNIHVLGTARTPTPTPAKFEARDGLLFIGAIHQPDSPNLDALRAYVHEILPALLAQGATPPTLHVAGYCAPDIDLGFLAHHASIKHHGPVTDLTPLYNQARYVLAPTRFAAGTPYKLYEAAAMGLPIITTNLLATQLGWTPGRDLLAATNLAAEILRAYNNKPLWTRLRKAALARITTENRFEDFNKTVAMVIEATIGAKSKRSL